MLAIVIAAAVGLYSSLSFDASAALLPRLALAVVLVCGMVILAVDLWRLIRTPTSPRAPARDWRATASPALWMLVFLLLFWTIGLGAGAALATALWLRVRSRASWSMSLGQAAVAWLFVEVVLARLLLVPLPEGLLFAR